MNINLTVKRLMQAAHYRFELGAAIVSKDMMGHKLQVCYGTIREKSGYDDGWIYALLTQSKTFFDVGCHKGWFTLLACLINSYIKVISIDTNPKYLAITAENLFLNGYSHQARFVLAFISDVDAQTLDFYTVGSGSAGSRYTSYAKTASDRDSFIHVKTTTLDTVAVDLGLQPDLVKIDVEGEEFPALKGANSIAHKRATQFIVEMHSRKELPMASNGERVLSWCRDHGYHAYYLKIHQRVTSPESFASRGRCHLLLQPDDWPYPEYLPAIGQGARIEDVNRMMRAAGLIK